MLVRLITITVLGAALAAASSPCLAHVAPAVDENNRYIKLSPTGSRLQIAYVVFAGDVPGRELRAEWADEHQARAEKLATEVADELRLEVDGRPVDVTWKRVAVDLSPAEQYPDALSVSMVAWICLGDTRTHELSLTDSFEFPPPGENQLKIEPGPGVTIEHSALGNDTGSTFEWIGLPNPMTEHGYQLRFSVDPDRTIDSDEHCVQDDSGESSGDDDGNPILVVAVVAGAASLLLLALLLGRRR